MGVRINSVLRKIAARVVGGAEPPQPDDGAGGSGGATEEVEGGVLNNGVLGDAELIAYDGLFFRSYSEVRVYQELTRRPVLVFANATAAFGPQGRKKEPDCLVCQRGRWGILEVMGDMYHPAATAMDDHNRARVFKDYGVSCIEFYDARECYNQPNVVADDFLRRLGAR